MQKNLTDTIDSIENRLTQWYHEPLGQNVQSELIDILKPALDICFGYHLLQIGGPYLPAWYKHSPIQKHLWISNPLAPYTSIQCRYDELPLQSDSIDVVILPHTLEYAANPDKLIAECQRVLIPEGHLFIIGVNPMSLWGLWRYPWTRYLQTPMHLTRLLNSQGCTVLEARSLIYRPPVQHPGIFRALHFLEYMGKLIWPYPGGMYVLHAQKRLSSVTPIALGRSPTRQFANAEAEASK
jgi:hypothetical protein